MALRPPRKCITDGDGNGHLRRDLGVGLQELEVREHGVVGGEVDLAGHPQALGLRLDAVELDAVVEHHALAARQMPEEIEMPPRAAELAVGGELQADLLLLPDDLADLLVLDGSAAASAVISPFSRLARASLSGAVRSRLPTMSARKGGLVVLHRSTLLNRDAVYFSMRRWTAGTFAARRRPDASRAARHRRPAPRCSRR